MTGIPVMHCCGEVIAAFAGHADCAGLVLYSVPAAHRAGGSSIVVMYVQAAFLAAPDYVLASGLCHISYPTFFV